jgi:predicted TIM-barrel enzyme
VGLIDAIAAAGKDVRPDVLVLCHGGPIAEPDDAAFILQRCPTVDGFYGASSMERLPTERAIREQTERFTRIRRA